MDMLKKRPVMPGSTNAPPPLGKTSVYQGTKKPMFTEEFLNAKRIREEELAMARSQGIDESVLQTGNVPNATYYSTEMRKTQQKAVNKAISQLPYSTREQVETFVGMALNTAEATTKELESARRENKLMRKQLGITIQELEVAKRTNNSLKQKLVTSEASASVMKEEVSAKQSFHLRNKHILEKVGNTNRLLVNSLEALGGASADPNANRPDSANSDNGDGGGGRKTLLKPIENAPGFDDFPGIIRPSTQGNDMLASRPNSSEEQMRGQSGGAGGAGGNIKEVPGSSVGLEKLKESLLRVTRQHLISQKANVNLDKEVISLRHDMRSLEASNRSMKNELDELRSVKSSDSPVSFARQPLLDGEEEAEKDVAATNTGKRKRAKNYGKLDQRFDALLKRDALDPRDGFMSIRRLLEYACNAPGTGRLEDIASYAVGSFLNKAFDCDGVALFLKPSINDFDQSKEVLYKYTSRSPIPEELEVSQYENSVAWKTIRSTHSQRLNSLSRNSTYNKEVDCVRGLVARRLLSTPIFSTVSGEVLGCFLLVNKQQAGDAFVESDELMMMVVSDQFSSLITNCYVVEKTMKSMNVYKNTLEASMAAYENVGNEEEGEEAQQGPAKKLSITDIISTVEESCIKALSCQRVRVFLISSHIPHMEPGNLIFLDNMGARSVTASRSIGAVTTIGPTSCVAGQVFTTKEAVEIRPTDTDLKARLNPQADLDVMSNPLVAVPVLDAHGEVFAVLEVVPSTKSPHMTVSEGLSDPSTIGNKIIFSQAAQWLAYSLAPSIQHLMFYVDRHPVMPTWFPLKYSALQITPFEVHEHMDESSIGSCGEETLEDEEDSITELVDARKAAMLSLNRRRSSVTTMQVMRQQENSLQTMEAEMDATKSQVVELTAILQGKDEEMMTIKTAIEAESVRKVDEATKAQEAAAAEAAKAQQAMEEQKIQFEATLTKKESEKQAALEAAAAAAARAQEMAAASRSNTAEDGAPTPVAAPVAAPAPVDIELDPNFIALKREVETVKAAQAAAEKKASDAEAAAAAASKATSDAEQAKAALEASTIALTTEVATLSKQLKEATEGQTALTASQTLNRQMSADLEKARADMVKQQTTITQLTEQLVKMAEESLNSKVEERSVATAAPAPAPKNELSASTKNALGLDMGSIDGSRDGGVNLEASIDTMGSEGMDEINAMLAQAAVGSKPPSAGGPPPKSPAGSAPGSRPLSARPPTTPPLSGRPKSTGSQAHTHAEGEALPHPWEKHMDEHGNVYYHNPESGETSWEIPQAAFEGFTESTEAYVGITLGEEWTQMFDTGGHEYFVNHESGESVWELPPEALEKYADVLSARPASSSVAAASSEHAPTA